MRVAQGTLVEEDKTLRQFMKLENKFVCSNHIQDYAVIDFISRNAKEGICSYCYPEDQDGNVVQLEELTYFLEKGITYFFGEANNEGVAYDSEEGGWLGTNVFDTDDLLLNELAIDIDDSILFRDISCLLPDYSWCRKDPYKILEHKELAFDWNRFCDLVKHKIRYTFFLAKSFDSERKELNQILFSIGDGVSDLNLTRKIDINTKIYRCRQHNLTEAEIAATFDGLTSPPIMNAIYPNRMSPAGISMFYGAFDEETAVTEIYSLTDITEKPYITIGTFNVTKELLIVDFTKLPQLSRFDETQRKHYYILLFFHSFVNDLSRKIKIDKENHIEYVPTQIMTEYFRYLYSKPIDGIIYNSSKDTHGKCCVLFKDNEESKDYLILEKTRFIDRMKN